jgi:ATP-dependent Lon protease
VGPPGVGKTSLGKSIARATGRDFVRVSLGGVRDEAEIRGHRRTYIGALPGKVLQSLKKAGSGNPVFLLDEVDKMSMDFRGDPSAALLEVLDPEQNNTFNDHYMDVDYDLSRIMFVCTANVLGQIPRPLQDRMEIIQLPGYIESEKLQIARRFLVPKVIEANGLDETKIRFSDAAILEIIRYYTREAGVRNLERELASICRKVACDVVKAGEEASLARITPAKVKKFLGVWKFRFGKAESEDLIGVCTGLAFTEVGGELLQTEVSVTPGRGKLQVTGRLGEVMQESANAALSYIRSRAKQLGLTSDFYSKVDIHIHVPEGATPKDGPSAGITIATTIASALTRIPVRSSVAMTGEITLRGRVLPIGGLKEKMIAAHRGGIETLLIPKDNEKDLAEIPANIKRDLTIITVEHMDEVLVAALALNDPSDFLRDGDHEPDGIVEGRPPTQPVNELPAPGEVN